MSVSTSFARGLSAPFVIDLESGRLHPVLEAAVFLKLDVQIRNDYLDIYSHGNCALSISENSGRSGYTGKVHHKFVSEAFLSHSSFAGSYIRFPISDGFLKSCAEFLKDSAAKALPYASKEAPVEERIVRASLKSDCPVVFFDRQVQIPGDSSRRKPDLMGLVQHDDKEPRIILAELKCGLDNRIQHLMGSMQGYYEIFAPDGYLRDDIFAAYRKVVSQKVRLGLLPSTTKLPDIRPVVECMIILHDYNAASELLPRLRERASNCQLRPWLIELPAGVYELPTPYDWGQL